VPDELAFAVSPVAEESFEVEADAVPVPVEPLLPVLVEPLLPVLAEPSLAVPVVPDPVAL
jgi:hypothetical protein